MQQHGFASVAINFRGCSGEPNRLARSYHSGETEDIDFLFQVIRQRYPQRAVAATGFSLGGNVLLKWLGERANPPRLFAAVAVSVPLVLSECASRLDNGFSRVYRYQLLMELKQYMANKLHHLEQSGAIQEAAKVRQLGDLRGIRSFWQYDDCVVAPLHGFADVHDYYRRSSSRQFLPYIQSPTLLIQSADDPFMTPKVLPQRDELSPQIQLELLPNGGHVGFIGSHRGHRPNYWLDQRIPAFFLQQLQS